MRTVLAVATRELGEAFDSPVSWVAFPLFALTQLVAFYVLGHPIGELDLPGLWAGGQASLDVLFAWRPLSFALLAPALTMGAWAEEARAGTDELLLSHPVSVRSLVWGKFLAAWLLLAGMATALILATAFQVARLGPLDPGTVVAGLVGTWALAAASVAVGLCASASTRDELVSYLVAALLLGGLWSAALFVRSAPPALAEVLWYASPALHFQESAARGLLDVRDLVYFGLFAFLATVLNVALVEGRRRR